MKWLTGVVRAIRHHRAAVTATAVGLIELAQGAPLVEAVTRALGELIAVLPGV